MAATHEHIAIAQQFLATFYQTFDGGNRASLGNFYRLDSLLSYEGNLFVGTEAIAKKLADLPFQIIQHAITTIDVQLVDGGSLLVFVIGQLKTDNDHPFGFSEAFVLKQFGDSLFVVNDVFRLALHHS